MFTQKPGTRVRVRYARDGQEREAEIYDAFNADERLDADLYPEGQHHP